MKYLTTTYEKFGVMTQADSPPAYCEVIGDIDIISFIQRRKPHLVNFDGERAYTKRPKELAKFAHNIKGSYKNYRLVFIPAKEAVTSTHIKNCSS
jgi:hypothetical protein